MRDALTRATYIETETETVTETAAASASEGRRVLKSCAGLTVIFAIVWLVSNWADRAFPYIKPGSDVIYGSKLTYIDTHKIFASDKPIKVLVVGNSKVLSGFIPDQFEQEVPGSTAFNGGFPDSNRFLPQLRATLAAGNIPTHILYAVGWDDDVVESRNIFHFLPSDTVLMNRLFPFRMLARNSAVFLMRSRRFGNPVESYKHAEEEVGKMEAARGYYFIEAQSRFPDHRLPANFHLAGDDPSQVLYRDPGVNTASFQQLKQLADQYHFKIVVIPYYQRKGQRGAPGKNVALANGLRGYPEFHVQGDEYYLFDNQFFSDTTHLNPDGARIYTSLVAELMKKELAEEQN